MAFLASFWNIAILCRFGSQTHITIWASFIQRPLRSTSQAVGVDAAQDASVIQANEAPTQKTIDEVNNAIDSQRGDRYTNGNGMPVEKVELPAAAV